MDSAETWQEVFRNLKANADTYLASEKIRSKYKNPETSITFRVDDMDHGINACVCKTDHNTYDIRVFAGLVDALENFSQCAISSYPSLFQSIDRQDQERANIAQSYLLYLWLDFVFCHEWAHVLCGHVDFKSGVYEWYEIENEEFSAKGIEDQICQCLEAEADSYAAKFSLARFSTYWDGLSKKIYPNLDGRVALRDYVMSMLLLFRFFEELRVGAKMPRNTHPTPFNRAFIFLTFCFEEYENIPGLPDLSSEEKEMLFGVTATEFYVKDLEIDLNAYLTKINEAEKFTISVGKTIEDIKLKNFRITK